ncbi:MAG: hypothetical protein PWQ17_1237 [Anaerophaga sp.]|nr:hypothetical protein [Anaerophaga sp.]
MAQGFYYERVVVCAINCVNNSILAASVTQNLAIYGQTPLRKELKRASTNSGDPFSINQLLAGLYC